MIKNSSNHTFTSSSAALMRRAGVAVLCGTLALSSVPASALAEGVSTASSAPATSGASASAQPSQPQGGAANGGSTPGDAPQGEPPSGGEGGQAGGTPGQGFGGGANTMTFDYTGTYSGAVEANGESVSVSGQTVSATEADKNAALAQNGGALALTGVQLEKSGDDTNGDNCNFYGVNSVLLGVGEGSSATISDSSINASSEGSNAIFATDGAQVLAWDTTIATSAGNSRGLDATYGGTILGDGLAISTRGDHSATLATDRGGGTVSVTNSELSTSGSGSPLLYSTGDIEVSGVSGTSTGSQIAAMEGLNTILINDSELTSTNTGTSGSDPVANGVIIYQSTSGDAEATTGETATFQVANSTLSSAIQSGAMFYLTNTSADIVLSHTTLDFDSDSADLLLAAGNDANNWGSAGSNGASVRFTAIGEDLAGNIEADTISSVDCHLTEGTTWTGAAGIVENSAGSTTDDHLGVSVDGTSTWVVTADSTVSSLTVADGGSVVDAQGRAVSIVADGQTVVAGDSDLTVTVTGSYSTDYDASAAGELASETADRSALDEAAGRDTSWTMGEASTTSTRAAATDATAESTSNATADDAAADTTADAGPLASFFSAIGDWFRSLLGL